MICPFEHLPIVYNSAYTTRTSKAHGVSTDVVKHLLYCYNFPEIAPESQFRYYYETMEYSLPLMKKTFGLTYSQTLFLIKYYKIRARNIQQSNSTKRARQQYKDTCLNKFGVDNVSKCEQVKAKKRETFMRNYGVDNIWKSPDYYVWLDNIMLEKYGQKRITDAEKISIYQKNKWDSQTKEERIESSEKLKIIREQYWASETQEQKYERHRKHGSSYSENYKNSSPERKMELAERMKKQGITHWESLDDTAKQKKLSVLLSGKCSKLEMTFQQYLNILGIDFIHSFYIGRKQYDYKLSDTNILIEIHGDFWHANPKKYKSDDLISYPNIAKKASDIWKNDENKRELATSNGYNVITIWEDFLLNETENTILKFIYDEIKKYKENN